MRLRRVWGCFQAEGSPRKEKKEGEGGKGGSRDVSKGTKLVGGYVRGFVLMDANVHREGVS